MFQSVLVMAPSLLLQLITKDRLHLHHWLQVLLVPMLELQIVSNGAEQMDMRNRHSPSPLWALE